MKQIGAVSSGATTDLSCKQMAWKFIISLIQIDLRFYYCIHKEHNISFYLVLLQKNVEKYVEQIMNLF